MYQPNRGQITLKSFPRNHLPLLFEQITTRISGKNVTAIFTAITFITMMMGLLAEYFQTTPILIFVLYTTAYVTGGWFGLKSGLQSLQERTIDVDLLMILAALGAAIVGAPFEGAMLLFLFSFSNLLQDYALGRTRNAIQALMQLRPDTALVQHHGTTKAMPINQVKIDDIFIIKPGDRIPLDGEIVSGSTTIDQASVTGESLPINKMVGQAVLAGTINQTGHVTVRVTKLAHDSTIARMITLVEKAQSEKAKTQRFLETAEQYYAMAVIGFTLLAIMIPIALLGETFSVAFYRAMTIMVAASPCALIISTPAAVLSAIGNAARRGILFKGGVYVEQAATIKVVAFDKTGTLTEGKPVVTDIKPITNEIGIDSTERLLQLVASLEAKSEHPLGQAIINMADTRQLELWEVTDFKATPGQGIAGLVHQQPFGNVCLKVGNLRYFDHDTTRGISAAKTVMEQLHQAGKTVVLVGQTIEQTTHIIGVIAIADQLRADAASMVADLKLLGIEQIVMLTGDNQTVAQAIAKQVGVDSVYAELLPKDKLQLVQQLQTKHGPVAMVGDGVNDAPALAQATIGVAMGAAGTDVALETADVVLLSDELSNIPYFLGLSHRTRRTLIVNLTFALSMIAVMVAAILTVGLSLPLAVLGHEGGTVLVSLNGLMLLGYRRRLRQTADERS